MNKELRARLVKKGWSQGEIKKTECMIEKSRLRKSRKVLILDKYIYLIALFVGVVGNIVVSVALVPFLLAVRGFYLYFFITIMGLSFGLFFEILIRDLGNLEKKRHFIDGAVIPLLALINMYIITGVIDSIGSAVHIPILSGFIYAVSFAFPYFVYSFILKKHKTKTFNIL